MGYFVKCAAIVCFIIGTTVVCKAGQPVCTGDRHYDGVACCPVVDPPPPVDATTTTTTLPGDPQAASCPTVVCGGTTVNVAPCVPSIYIPCHRRKDGSIRCPKPHYKGRVLVPAGSMGGAF